MNKVAEYERKLSGSYMKIGIEQENTLDERILLKSKPKGMLSMEKCFCNGKAEYWYQISGKQSLESFCQFHEIGISFVEKVIVSICSQIAILEKHMLCADGLLLQPEYVFVDNHTQEILFTFYPCDTVVLSLQLQRLMEYLLTKINHKDTDAVAMAYELYEKTLEEGYSIWDIQASIAKSRESRTENETVIIAEAKEPPEKIVKPQREERDILSTKENGGVWALLLQNEAIKEWGAVFKRKKEKIKTTFNKREKERIVYPSAEETQRDDAPLHPTICLSDYREHPDGLLLYEGYENFADIRLEKKTVIIGKGEGADIRINKETISHVHAKLSYENEEYYLEDLNSTNGCTVNSQMLSYHERKKLSSNDILCFADVKYRFI